MIHRICWIFNWTFILLSFSLVLIDIRALPLLVLFLLASACNAWIDYGKMDVVDLFLRLGIFGMIVLIGIKLA